MTALDIQEGGDHYKRMGVQPWQAFESWLTLEQHQGFLLGTATAYLARFNSEGTGKGGLQDVKKAIHTLQRLVDISEAPRPCTIPAPVGNSAAGPAAAPGQYQTTPPGH